MRRMHILKRTLMRLSVLIVSDMRAVTGSVETRCITNVTIKQRIIYQDDDITKLYIPCEVTELKGKIQPESEAI